MENSLTSVSFYFVPILIFGPIFFLILWFVGLRDVIVTPPAVKEQRRREKEEAEMLAASKARKRGGGRFTRRDGAGLSPLAWAGQGVAYLLFAGVVGYLSSAPEYTYFDAGDALIKLSLSHPGKRKVECRRRTRQELAELPPNMRAPMKCPRERWPVEIELTLDGKPLYRGVNKPAGLAGDGASSFYEKFPVAAGVHRLAVRLVESGEAGGADYVLDEEVRLVSSQVLVVGFRSDAGRLFLK